MLYKYLFNYFINIITTMRKPDHDQIKEELSKFINLLQSDFSSSPQPQSECQSYNQYPLTKKLSIILSASEPQSSSLDKENSNPSANRSFESNQKPSDLANSRKNLIQTLMTTTLSSSQLKLIERIREYIEQLRASHQRQSVRIQELQRQLVGQKKANDQMLNVLIKLDKQEKQLWDNYNLVTEKYEELNERFKLRQGELKLANDSLLSLQNDNDFMKKLIFHANQNYQALEKKCKGLEVSREKSGNTTNRRSIQNSSIDNLLKSAKTKKNGQSPSHSEVLRSPSPENFQQVYRKMIIRTLKFKGRSPRHIAY